MINNTVSNTPDNSNRRAILLFSSGMGLSILGYLNPLHSPIGHDFLVNVFSVIVISLMLSSLLFVKFPNFSIKSYGISLYTWLSVAILLCIQPLLSNIKYPDALIFPIGSLILVMLVSIVCTNLLNTASAKRQFINQVSIWLYLMLVLNFIIQVMQAMNYSITVGGWPVTRLSAIFDRMDGNFGQANHTSYAYMFGICCVIYQLQTLKNRTYQLVLLLLLAIFSVSISLTKSRAVLIMFVVGVFIYFFAQKDDIKKQLSWCAGITAVFVISYLIGGFIVAELSPEKVEATGGVGRLASLGADTQRMALLKKSILIFEDYPLTGIGWRNFAIGAIPHVDEMPIVTFSDNSHMVFTQIASELGILGLLCLLPVLVLLFRSFHNRHSAESAMALSYSVVSCIYACFEYPLWYVRFLAVFALFLAMIEQKNYVLKAENTKLSGILGSIAVVLVASSSYYLYQYWTHQYLFWYGHPNLVVDSNGKKTIKGKPVFGFLNYNDMDLASTVEISPSLLPQKLAVFDRVVVDESSPYNLVSYGQLLSFNGEYDKALDLFKTACRMNEDVKGCDAIGDVLRKSAQDYPMHFQTNYTAYQAWLKNKNLK